MDKKKGKLKRGMGILLAVVMLFNTLPISGFAVSASEKQETGLCEHHTEHTKDCGYSSALEDGEGSSCTYDCRICPIEDLIAALPDEVTEDNAKEVRTQLNKILALYRELTAEEQEQIDISRCLELQEALDAANAPTPIEEPSEDAVAMVEKEGEDPSYVTSLADAFVAGNSGAKITLLTNVDIGETGLNVPSNTEFTLDCGSFTLSGNDVDGTLRVYSGSVLTFVGGTVRSTGRGAAVLVMGTFTMSGGVLDSTSSFALLVNNNNNNARVTVTGGTVGVNGTGLYVNDNSKATIALSGGTYSSIYPGREGTYGNYTYRPVSSVLAPGYALKGADGFIRGDATGNQKTVTVGECEHKGVTPTPNNDGTHSLKCPYCGYTGPAEDCSYGTEYQHDDTDHWLTCTACGYENKEAHNWEFDSAQSGNVIENHRECFACRRTKDHLTLTITVPDGLTYGNTEGKKVTYTVSPEKTCDKVRWRFTSGDWPEFADGVLPANLPVGEHWFRVEGLMSDDTIVFSGSYYFTVAPAPLTVDMVKLSPESVTYNGTEQKPAITVKQGETTLAEGTDYDVTYSTTDFTNVGTITVTITGKGNYKGTMKKTYSIAKAPLTIKASNQEITYGDNIETNLGGSALGPVVYDNLCTGDKLESINFTPSTENVPGGTIKLSGAVIKNSKGEDVTGNYDTTYEDGTLTINKAEGKLSVPKTSFEKKFRDEDFSLGSTSNVGNISYTSSNVDVALVSADGKVQIKGVGTANITVSLAESKNYTGDEETVTVTVGKADTPTVDNQLKQYICGKGSGGNTVKTDISEKLPSDRGNTVYTFTSDEAGILSDVGIDENGMLTYKVGTGTANTAASVTVTAEMENYKTADFVLTIKLVDKIKVEITAKAENAVYDGKLHKGYADGITCDYPVEGYEFIYNGRGGTVYGSSEPPKDAGSYTVTISVSDKSGDYEEKSVSLNFTVEKSSISIKADNKSVNKGAPLPKLTYTVSGLAEKDSLASAPEITCNADTKTEGSYTITVGGAKVPDTKNYNGEITYENGTLTVIKPAGGSSGGGSADGSGGTGTTLIPSTPAVTTTSDGTVVSLNKDGAYVDKNGKPAADTLIKEPTGEMHVTDSTGHIVKDVIVTTADKTTYVVGAKGNVVVSDIVEIKGNKYVADGKGQLVVSSFSTVGGEKYYSDAKGLVKTAGFFNVSGKKYYADEDGVIAVRKLITVNGRKYFAAKGGAIASKKIVTTGGKKYYAAKSGKIAEKKVVKAGGKKYFATGDGSLATGKWVKAGNKKYFCNKKGVITKTKKIKAY